MLERRHERIHTMAYLVMYIAQLRGVLLSKHKDAIFTASRVLSIPNAAIVQVFRTLM